METSSVITFQPSYSSSGSQVAKADPSSSGHHLGPTLDRTSQGACLSQGALTHTATLTQTI